MPYPVSRATTQDNNFHKFCSKNLILEISQLEQSAKYSMQAKTKSKTSSLILYYI